MNKNAIIIILLLALSGSWAYFFGLNQGRKDNPLPQNPPIVARQELSKTPQNKAVSLDSSFHIVKFRMTSFAKVSNTQM